jgi:HD-GYP domain-containing protein (c-di-GMP phosphodiesterase class II)
MEKIPTFRVRISTILPDMTLPFDLYLEINNNKTIYLRAGSSISKEKIASLQQKDSGEFFSIHEQDRQLYRDFIRSTINSTTTTPNEKAKVLRESSYSLMEELFENPDVHKALADSRPIIKDFLSLMEAEPQTLGYMIGLSAHDFYTYNHSLDVSIYSLGLGAAIGFSKTDLEELGLGALFHDIGKRHVPLEILCKKGPLDAHEWSKMQMHPQFGLAILNENPTISLGMKAACFEHHESFLGNGYPQQLPGPEIHPYARIVAITDTYDAMTTQRSYNVPMKPIDAVTMMKEKLGGKFDPEMIKAYHSVLFKLGL